MMQNIERVRETKRQNYRKRENIMGSNIFAAFKLSDLHARYLIAGILNDCTIYISN